MTKSIDDLIGIRKDIAPGDYLYYWPCQGYVKVLERKLALDKGIAIGEYLTVSLGLFHYGKDDPIDINFRGELLSIYSNSLISDIPGYFFFNDLDQYYEYVKATTNTPSIV